MKTLIVVKSTHHQNTARVAQIFAEILQCDVASPDDVTPGQVAEYDLVGFGSGIYYGRFHSTIRKLVRSLPPTDKPGAAFLFSTSGLPFLKPLYHWPLRRRLNKLGYLLIGEFGCRGFDTWGPLCLLGGLNRKHPDEKDLVRARRFAEQIKAIREGKLPFAADA
jgi:flavodoxin